MAKPKTDDKGLRVRETRPVVVDDADGWTFVNYDNGGYSLVDPDGRHVMPTDKLSAEDVERLRR